MSKFTHATLALFLMTFAPLAPSHATSVLQTTQAEPAKAQTSARAFFVDLKNNDEVSSPLTVKFGIEGLKIAPAGITKSDTGHFHLFIDAEPLTEEQKTKAIPADLKHIDFPSGQSQVNLVLPAGEHKLQLVMGNGAHKLHNPPIMSEIITIKVK